MKPSLSRIHTSSQLGYAAGWTGPFRRAGSRVRNMAVRWSARLSARLPARLSAEKSRAALLALVPLFVFYTGVFDEPAVHAALDEFDAAVSSGDADHAAKLLDPHFVGVRVDTQSGTTVVSTRDAFIAWVAARTGQGKVVHARRKMTLWGGTVLLDCQTFSTETRDRRILTRMIFKRQDGQWRVLNLQETVIPIREEAS